MNFAILTQREIVIDLSVPAMKYIVENVSRRLEAPAVPDDSVECEVSNFLNLMHNLIERHSDNSDLI